MRPRRELLRTAAVSLLAAMVPLTAALWAVATARGNWGVVLGLELAILLGCLAVVLRRHAMFVEVTATELRGNGIATPLVTAPFDRIAAAYLVPTYVLGSEVIVTQLLVTDAEGRRLFRMRSIYWEDGDLERVARALPVRPHVIAEPMRLSEFWRHYPTSEYWFENKPAGRVLSVLGVCLLSVLLR